jgi:serine/threonine protein kinase/Tfp pilus assembly protein PilF
VHDSTLGALEGGLRFGVYEIDCREDGRLYELGRGAMGVTYRATDTTLQRKVALKIIKADIAERSADARERFMREARAAAALRHENIAVIHQFGMLLETGQYFYAMELIDGETLDERVRRAGPLDAHTTIQIAQQVTSALAAAEKQGLVHRDLKPANLMLVSPGGETGKNKKLLVKIIDFGLAKAVHSQIDPKSLTHDKFVGTPAFASPEQFEHSALDVRSDIYSLGETLWFALTGRTPFSGRTMEEIHRAQKSNALPIKQLKAAHVPSRIRSLLESMLAFEPASRPGTQELATHLQRCSPEARGVRRMRTALAAAALLILGMSALFVFRPLRNPNAVLNAVSDKSIAILPFENLSADPDNAYFATGVQNEILTRLAKVAALKVISHTSTQQYPPRPRNLREIARQLGVANVLEGRIQKAAGQVHINVQLIRAATDEHLWAESYDRKLENIFTVEAEVASAVVDALKAKLSAGEQRTLQKRPTNSQEAYDAYLRGLAYSLRPFYNGEENLNAIKYFREAARLDPKFALAWAWLGRESALGYFNRIDTDFPALREAARRAADKAIELQPDLSEAYLAQGYSYYYGEGDYDSAIASFEKATSLSPNNSDVFTGLGLTYRRKGEWQRSLDYLREATELDPRNTSFLSNLVETLTALRQYSAALKIADQILDLVPGNPDAQAAKISNYQAQGNLPAAAQLLSTLHPEADYSLLAAQVDQWTYERRYAEAIASLKEALPKSDAPWWFKLRYGERLARLQQLSGDSLGARATWEQLQSEAESVRRAKGENFSALQLASAYLALGGDETKAFAILEQVSAMPRFSKDVWFRSFWLAEMAEFAAQAGKKDLALEQLATSARNAVGVDYGDLKFNPVWDPLRGDPRFEQIVGALAPKKF